MSVGTGGSGVIWRPTALVRSPQSFVPNYERGNGNRRIDLLELLRIVEALKADPRKVFVDSVARRGGEAELNESRLSSRGVGDGVDPAAKNRRRLEECAARQKQKVRRWTAKSLKGDHPGAQAGRRQCLWGGIRPDVLRRTSCSTDVTL